EDLAQKIIEEYQPESVEDMQNALKDIFGPMFESMLKGEMNHHLGYESNDKTEKETENRRNGYGDKTVHTSAGEVDIQVPRDRDMLQRDISSTVEAIYGVSVFHDMGSDITDNVLPELEEWQARPLESCYAFVFVDCMYTTIRNQYETKKYAVYTILGYTMEGT